MNDEQLRLNQLFIQEVRNELRPNERSRSQKSPSVVFLYRSAIRSLGIFDDILKYAQQLDLQYFSSPKQAEFLAKYINWKRPSDFDIRQSCADCLTALKDRLAAADEASAETFFGHAPVLMALGDLILEDKSQNPQRVAMDLLEEAFHANKGVQLVKRIIRRLLEREVPKFPKESFLAKKITAFEPYPVDLQNELLNRLLSATIEKQDWEKVISEYVAYECSRRLAADANTKGLPMEDRKWLEDQYAKEIALKFSQHPFIGIREKQIRFTNPIYEERYLAEYLLKTTDANLPRVFTAYPAPSYYLAQFVLDALADRDLKGRQGLIFYVLRSLSMASRDQFEAKLFWSGGRWEANVDTGKIVTEPFWYSDEILLLEVPDGQIFENVSVEGGEGTFFALNVLASDNYKRRITLSQVDIQAGEIEIEATHISCDAVRLSGGKIHLTDAITIIDGVDSLTVQGEIRASEFIKKKYEEALTPHDPGNDDAFLRKKLNQMFAWFRKRGAESYAVYRRRFNTVVLKKGQDIDADKVARFLRREGILREKEHMIVVDQDKLARYGVYYVKQNLLGFREEFRELVKRWAESKSA